MTPDKKAEDREKASGLADFEQPGKCQWDEWLPVGAKVECLKDGVWRIESTDCELNARIFRLCTPHAGYVTEYEAKRLKEELV